MYPDPDEEKIEDVVLDDDIESAIGTWFSRKKMEGWVGRRLFYMQKGGMSTIRRSRRC